MSLAPYRLDDAYYFFNTASVQSCAGCVMRVARDHARRGGATLGVGSVRGLPALLRGEAATAPGQIQPVPAGSSQPPAGHSSPHQPT